MIGGEAPKLPPQHYGDVAVLAFPAATAAQLVPVAASDGLGKALDAAKLADGDLATGVDIAPRRERAKPGAGADYGKPVTARTLSLFAPGAAMMFVGALYSPVLEASDNGNDWRKVTDFETAQVAATYGFAPVTRAPFPGRIRSRARALASSWVRPRPALRWTATCSAAWARRSMAKPLTIGDFRLFGEARIDRFETKAGFAIAQDYYALTSPADGATGIAPGSVIDLTDRMKPDGSLDWTPPSPRDTVARAAVRLFAARHRPTIPLRPKQPGLRSTSSMAPPCAAILNTISACTRMPRAG